MNISCFTRLCEGERHFRDLDKADQSIITCATWSCRLLISPNSKHALGFGVQRITQHWRLSAVKVTIGHHKLGFCSQMLHNVVNQQVFGYV